MKQVIQRQSEYCSIFDVQKFCSVDTEVILEPTKPLIHQAARFLFIRDGRATLRIQGRDYALSKGSVAMIFPWEITEVTAVETPIQYDIVKYNFDIVNFLAKTLGFLDRDEDDMFGLLEQNHVVACNPEDWPGLLQTVATLEEELGIESVNVPEQPHKFPGTFCATILLGLIVRINRACMGESAAHKAEEFDKSELLRYIYLHLGEKLSLELLSQKFFISQSSIRRYIHAMTGLTFNDLLSEMRIAKTANYLLYTDFTLDELAEILGFVDAPHISKMFTARVGMKIHEYRKNYQNVQRICNIAESRKSYAIINYIARNYAEVLTAQRVADEHGVSVQELNRLLVYQLGHNFSDFLTQTRVNNACRLLLKTNKSVTDIALEVGYNTVKTFNRNFVNCKLMSPSEFRSRVQMQSRDI